tara:strand:+ start:218 stop:901 length:684 start_codon:yes stop_codon:yes gene_type:complete
VCGAEKPGGRALSLFAAYNLPFAVALALMVMLAISQLIGLGDMIGDADMDVDVHANLGGHADAGGDLDGAGGALASLLGWGRLPLLLWLSLFLFFFAATGALLQSVLIALTAAPLTPLLAAIAAIVPAVFLTGLIARPLARILPHDETSAVSRGSLVGRRGQIVTGRAKAGSPARARVLDPFGQPHHVMVEPHDDAATLEEGEAVLLVRRDDDLFYAVAVEQRFLTD